MKTPLRWTGNFQDQIYGRGYHSDPISFHEFLTKQEGQFVTEPEFMQIPGYIQFIQDIMPIEDDAREYVVKAIIRQYENRLIGMQDYVWWGKQFENKCASLAPAFWAQVNMLSTMNADDLEMDENTVERKNIGTGNSDSLTTNAQLQASKSTGRNSTTMKQITESTPVKDASTREATANVVRAPNEVSDELDYPWSQGADSVHEVRTTASATQVTVITDGDNNYVQNDSTGRQRTLGANQNTAKNSSASVSAETQRYTNKQFMQERRLAVETAQNLLPLDWLFRQLDAMFWGVW